jgi:ABC-2 type transport system ATP-binding protein
MSILLEQIQKSYGKHEALRGITLQIETGMFGLLGPNGAGKTTLLRILATVLQPTHGRVVIDGYDPARPKERRDLRSHLGYLPQTVGFYPELTGREFLDYMGLLKQFSHRSARRTLIETLLDDVGLTPVADRKVKTYSGGMKQRLGIAQALLGHPRLVIVDEPMAGLDPEERIRLRLLLTRLAQDRTIILSTHVVEDIEQTCEHLAVLHDGVLAFSGSSRALMEQAEGYVWQVQAGAQYLLPSTMHVISAVPGEDGVCYRVVGQRPEEASGVKQVLPLRPTLEDGYVWLQHRPKDSQTSCVSR